MTTHWVGTTKASVFAYRPYEFDPDKNYYTKIPLTAYCKNKFITKKQARTLIRKKWLAVTHFRGQTWVHEICPELINDFLQVP
jgi:hypothetical protein